MPTVRVFKIERLADRGETLAFFIRPPSRSRPWTWFKPQEVPQFDGREARFECERIKGGWRVLRRVEETP